MAPFQHGRHLPAFILLFLLEKPGYGNALLNEMNGKMPRNFADGPAVYRALNELEKNGFVTSSWDASSAGAAKKYYTITDSGKERLEEFKVDIERRVEGLEFFLTKYRTLSKKRSSSRRAGRRDGAGSTV